MPSFVENYQSDPEKQEVQYEQSTLDDDVLPDKNFKIIDGFLYEIDQLI